MKKEILISSEANEKRVAVLEDGKLEEFYIERADAPRMFGNIYKGRVKSVVPGIGASFIDLGMKKDGFLYVTDALDSSLGESAYEDIEPEEHERKHRGAIPRIDTVLKVGQEVIVQVVKEPIRGKGARLTTHFSIPARFLVLMPGDSHIGISRRIESREERDRIRGIFSEMELPKDIGVIVRTAGEGKSKKEYIRDVRYLLKIWEKIKKEIDKRKAPCLIHEELDLVQRIVRDHFTEDIDRIVMDHYGVYSQVKRFFRLYLPDYKPQVEWYRGNVPLFEKFNIEQEIAKTFQRTVMLRSGGHIVIEQTEGLVAIDVNTGKFTGHRNLEETVYRTNVEAAEEIARQARLRDIGGIVIIDFIDMDEYDHRRHVFRTLRDAVRKRDRAKTNILQMSELGLVEMTRQRIRPSLESAVYNSCPYCAGKGVVKSATTMAIQSVKEIKKALNTSKGKVLNVYVHPDVAERLTNQERRAIQELEHHSKSRVVIFVDPILHIEDINITFVQ